MRRFLCDGLYFEVQFKKLQFYLSGAHFLMLNKLIVISLVTFGNLKMSTVIVFNTA